MKKRQQDPEEPPVSQNQPGPPPGHSLAEDNPEIFPVVGIGASAGGLEALSRLIRNLPSKTGMAFVYIQHLDPTHKSLLTSLLSRETRIPVRDAEDGLAVLLDHLYVIPPNADLTLSGGDLKVTARSGPRGMHMPIDEFFESLAADKGTTAIGIVLSGTGSDGSAGIRAIKEAGGITFAQGMETAEHGDMPENAIATGSMDFILSPENIAEELVRIARHPFISHAHSTEWDEVFAKETDALDTIFSLIRNSSGLDFSHYKRSTVQRRIARRIILHKIGSIGQYAKFLADNPTETATLAEDMLIHVTSFFREPDTFGVLVTEVFPRFYRERPRGLPIRIWVPGCSTGEEAYSILISLIESLGEHQAIFPVQLFASDVSENSLAKARTGFYSEPEMLNVSEDQRTRFFDRVEGGYQVKKCLREICVFARHDLTKDPPFSHLDMISCRNLLIYLGVPMQRKIIPLFHYALDPGGFLLLGVSETIGPFPYLFQVVNKKFRIYVKKPALDLPHDRGATRWQDPGKG